MADGRSTILVFSAHAADFVWRAGGAIALYVSRGYRVRILCLSFGERGESAALWKQPGMTVDTVKKIREAESRRAAEILGADVCFFDAGDYPLVASEALMRDIVTEYRRMQPTFVLTHSYADPYNSDHPETAQISLKARIYAQAAGYPLNEKAIGAPPVFMFEPHQSEQCGFRPEVLLDITPVFDRKRAAMESMDAQQHLWEYYTEMSKRRGEQARRNSGNSAIKFAEGYQRVFPHVTSELS